MFNGETAPWNPPDEIFSNTFESWIDKTQSELDDDFKSSRYKVSLELCLDTGKNIKIFVHGQKTNL